MNSESKYKLEDLNEDNINDFFICRLCKEIIHRSENPTRGNYECIRTGNSMDSTIIVECEKCIKKRLDELQKESNRNRLNGFLKYFQRNY
jgi:hypothetical protein